jgi:hypothetical protein
VGGLEEEMKVYCVLFDTMPFENDLIDFAERNSADFHHQVSNCYTTTSVLSLLSSLLPSQIIENGVGYHTPERMIENGEHWNDFILFDKLDREKWSMFTHNSIWVKNNIFNKFDIERTTSLSCGDSGEVGGVWGKRETEDLLTEINNESKLMQQREIEHVREIQKRKTTKNEFHFIIYHHYHALVTKPGASRDAVFQHTRELMNAWDFNEENAAFWFFADHGDFTKIDEFCSPPHAWTTWAITKNNITKKRSSRKLISILDFIPSLTDVFDVKINGSLGQDIYHQDDLNRIFLFEDSRACVDLFRSTTAAAVSCKLRHHDGTPKIIEQTSFYLPTRDVVSMNFDYDSRSLCPGGITFKDDHLREMKKIFKWIP